jgi:hypothetical protein
MVNTLSIECPHCSKKFDVFLSSSATMVILNCPLCLTPLIYYKTRCFVLSKKQVDRIRKSRQDTTALKILHSIAREETGNWNQGLSVDIAETKRVEPIHVSYESHPVHSLALASSITTDDIVNLKIDLETCTDAKHFIDKL